MGSLILFHHLVVACIYISPDRHPRKNFFQGFVLGKSKAGRRNSCRQVSMRLNLATSRSKLALLGAIGLVLMVAFTWLALGRAPAADRLLFGGVAPADAAAMAAALDAAGVPYRPGLDGGSIFVAESALGRARMLLAAQGLPNPGPAGYELMDNAQALGSTQFRDEITYLRALEGELARTIGSLAGIRSAKVHVVMARREPFSREWTPPTASVLLTVTSPDLVGREQVAAIRHLVAASVARLSIEDVSVVDNFGNLLARAERGPAAELDRNDERRVALEDRLARAVEEQLAPIVGVGRVRAKVTAELDLSSERRTEENFDPLAQVPRSEQTETERERTDETEPNVSVARDLPEAVGQPPTGSKTDRERERRTINYEINRTTSEQVVAAGAIKRLSISVAVDGPRGAEELALLERLARAATGFSAGRGDVFEIASIPFAALEPASAEAPPEPADPGLAQRLGTDLWPIAIGGGVGIVGLLVAAFALLRARARRAGEAAGAQALLDSAEQRPAAEPEKLAAEAASAALAKAPEAMVDLGGNVQGPVRQTAITCVQEIIDRDPEGSAMLLRSWLREEGAR
jgi:flagellar M-ring protein FliF